MDSGMRVRFYDAGLNEIEPPEWARRADESPEAETADGAWDRAFDAHVDRGLGL